MDNEFRYEPVAAEDIPLLYPDAAGPHLANLLNWYKQNYANSEEGASFNLPLNAVRTIEKLGALSSGRGLVLSSDRGYSTNADFKGLHNLDIAIHGSFSCLVNYHAIGVYVAERGGFALHEQEEDTQLIANALVLAPSGLLGSSLASSDSPLSLEDTLLQVTTNRSLEHFPFLVQAFEDEVNSFGTNDFHIMHLLRAPWGVDEQRATWVRKFPPPPPFIFFLGAFLLYLSASYLFLPFFFPSVFILPSLPLPYLSSPPPSSLSPHKKQGRQRIILFHHGSTKTRRLRP